jgi:hypothetical protein
VKLSS